jgi:hypothetical protein
MAVGEAVWQKRSRRLICTLILPKQNGGTLRFGAFIVILAGVVFSTCAPATLPNESLAPAFMEGEAMAKVGQRVRWAYASDRYRCMKCPEQGESTPLRVGEHGSIVGMKEVSPKNYFLVVRWDESQQSEPLVSYFGRKTHRVFLEEE